MSADTVAPPQIRPRPGNRCVRGLAWALLLGCGVVLGAVLLVGERPASYDDLRTALEDGSISTVRVEGGLPQGSDGEAGAAVHWRDGLIGRVAAVRETTSHRLDGRLTAIDPDVRVTRTDRRNHGDIEDWRVPAWCDDLNTLVAIGALVLLVSGPQPRVATRWGWLWLMWLALPLGLVAFLVLSGRLSSRSHSEGRRLTGGWAFLLGLVLRGALAAVATALL